MEKILFIIFCLIGFTNRAFSQSLTGVIIDETKSPVEFANVVLLALPDSTFIQGTISDQSGSFVLASEGKQGVLRISSVGYATVYKACASEGSVGTIQLNSDTQLLGEVVIKGDLPVTRMKGDAMVTNVQNSILSKAGTAVDVLGKVPGVMKNSKNDLEVFGRGAPEIYINGRKVRDNSELDQLSSDNIKSVEVVKTPGARYAASVKAVIRILTKKTVGDGWGFNNRAVGRYDKKWTYMDQFNMNFRSGGMDLFGMLYYMDRYGWAGHHTIEKTYLDKVWTQNVHQNETSHTQNFSANAGMNYIFNPDNSIGIRYELDRTPEHSLNYIYDTDLYKDNDLSEHSITDNNGYQQSTQHALNAYYNGKLGGWSIDFNSDLLWKKQNQNDRANESCKDAVNQVSNQTVTSFTNSKASLYAGKLIFTHDLWGGQFSFGGEYSYTHRTSRYNNVEGILNNDDNKINESMQAIFIEYTHKFGKLDMNAGVRYEGVNFDYYQDGKLQGEQSKTYNNVFPSLSLAMPVGKTEIRLSYKADIDRPTYYQLRSNVSYANRYGYESGNPFLVPTITHNIGLSALYRWLNFYVGFQRIKDAIIYTNEPYSENNPAVALLSQKNADAYNCLKSSLTVSPVIGIWSPQWTVSVDKQWYEVESPQGIIHMDKPWYMAQWNNAFNFPGNFVLNADLDWYGRGDSQNTSIRTSWGMNLSLYKGFMDDRLTFLLQGNDLFLSRRSSAFVYFGKVRTMYQRQKPNTRNVVLTVRYKFNSSKSKYKGTGAGASQKNRI